MTLQFTYWFGINPEERFFMRSVSRTSRSITEQKPHLLFLEDPLASFRMSKRSSISKIILVIVYIVCCRS